ncbi:M28 family peptidase [Acidianus sulfidivorans JP7]|uniref:Zn-dependent exopeptidase M28 n=1 Tax=Acidianus sulfidivorans JP7 TaxID=619593 RepID=A0A2U9IPS8_9CREN|nr:M28 family peptidase [Acidianus sulfidivorans]AWR98003.1 M28 family peptidase [Acidianus sulfidivorans JP7]
MDINFSKSLLTFGEAIHGGENEKKILNKIEEFADNNNLQYKRYPIETKYWNIKREEVYVNGRKIKASLLPYTFGCVKGRVNKEIKKSYMPNHPFDLKEAPEDYEGYIVIDNKRRRIVLSKRRPVSFIVTEDIKEGDNIELCGEADLENVSSYNLEVTLNEPRKDIDEGKYFIIGAHVDHWLTGFHDNLFSISLALSIRPKIRNHGLKMIFFSSEEGPRCCTGSTQMKKGDDIFLVISLDALYPNRLVFSSTPELWKYSSSISSVEIKRVEMPTPFSDHFPYVLEGYPAIAFYNDDLIPYYHTDEDLPNKDDETYFERVKNALEKLIEELDRTTTEDLNQEFYKITGVKDRKGAIMPDYKNLTSKLISSKG